MNAFSRPFAVTLPALSPDWVQLWIEKTQDLVFMLDRDAQIAGVFQNQTYAQEDVHHWIGQNLASIVSAESQPKLPLLFENDVAQQGADARWRHINLMDRQGGLVPVLSRCMSLPGGESLRALFCRDLRSMQDLNNRFISVQQALEQDNLALRARMQAQGTPQNGAATLPIACVVESIKQNTYEQAIAETVQNLEKQCLHALLQEAGGIPARAAELAGLSLQQWLDKAARFALTAER